MTSNNYGDPPINTLVAMVTSHDINLREGGGLVDKGNYKLFCPNITSSW